MSEEKYTFLFRSNEAFYTSFLRFNEVLPQEVAMQLITVKEAAEKWNYKQWVIAEALLKAEKLKSEQGEEAE